MTIDTRQTVPSGPTEPKTPRAAFATRSPLAMFVSRFGLWIALVLLIVVAELASGGAFLDPQNLINVLAQNSVAGVLAVGQTFVILTSGIDLSLGSITALSSMAMLLVQTQGFGFSRLVGLGIALGCGLINGLLVTYGRVPPFVATLGMMQAALGLAYVIGGGYPAYETTHTPLLFGLDRLGPVPSIVVVWLIVVVIGWFLSRRTRFGANVYVTGGNERAARTSGVSTNRTKVIVYGLAGLCAGIAGILWIDRLGSTQPNIGTALTLASIAPVVVGGTSLFGGIGGVWNTLAGVLIVGVLVNVMVLVGIDANIQEAVQGVIILVVVFLFVRQRRRRA